MANDNFLEIDRVLEKNVHECHVFFAHRIDKQKLEADLRKPGNVTRL